MGKSHIKSLSAPASWPVERKDQKFLPRPYPGAHPLDEGMPLSLILKEMVKCAKTTKEVKSILNDKELLVDGKKRKEIKMFVGLMDVIEIPELKQCFRVLINKKGKIKVVEIKKDEAEMKPCKITGITIMKKGKMQVNLSGGRNIIVDKKAFKVGDTLVISLPDQKIKETIPMEKGCAIYLTGGKHVGCIGHMDEIKKGVIRFKLEDGSICETSKDYAFAIGKDKPAITIQ